MSVRKRKMLRILAWVGVAAPLLYVGGYFVLMNVHRPTSPYMREHDYYESSFRWAPAVKASKSDAGEKTPFPEVTIWNVIFRPADKLYFALFPRTSDEREKLREIGYYR